MTTPQERFALQLREAYLQCGYADDVEGHAECIEDLRATNPKWRPSYPEVVNDWLRGEQLPNAADMFTFIKTNMKQHPPTRRQLLENLATHWLMAAPVEEREKFRALESGTGVDGEKAARRRGRPPGSGAGGPSPRVKGPAAPSTEQIRDLDKIGLCDDPQVKAAYTAFKEKFDSILGELAEGHANRMPELMRRNYHIMIGDHETPGTWLKDGYMPPVRYIASFMKLASGAGTRDLSTLYDDALSAYGEHLWQKGKETGDTGYMFLGLRWRFEPPQPTSKDSPGIALRNARLRTDVTQSVKWAEVARDYMMRLLQVDIEPWALVPARTSPKGSPEAIEQAFGRGAELQAMLQARRVQAEPGEGTEKA